MAKRNKGRYHGTTCCATAPLLAGEGPQAHFKINEMGIPPWRTAVDEDRSSTAMLASHCTGRLAGVDGAPQGPLVPDGGLQGETPGPLNGRLNPLKPLASSHIC